MKRLKSDLRSTQRCIGIAIVCLAVLMAAFVLFYHPFKADVHYATIPTGKIAYCIRGGGRAAYSD